MPKPNSTTRLHKLLAADPSLADRLLLVAEPTPSTDIILKPADLHKIVYSLLAGRDHEALAVVALDRRHRVIGTKVLTVGTDCFTVVDPKGIYRWALLQGRCGAAAIAIAHNHPSMDPTPSAQDVDITRRIDAAGRILGIKLLDHLVVADHETTGRYCSLAEMGHLTRWTVTPVVTG